MKGNISTRAPSRLSVPPPRRGASPVIGQPVDLTAWEEVDRQRTVRLAKLGDEIERRVTAFALGLGALMLVIMVARVALSAWEHG